MVELTMAASMGADWLNYFDICVASARKPLFQRAESPFCRLDARGARDLRADKIHFMEQMSLIASPTNKIFLEGSASLLTQHF